MGVIGSGSRGTFVMGVFQKDPAAARRRHLRRLRAEPGTRRLHRRESRRQRARRSIAITRSCWPTRDVQAVLIATPEHWHYQMVLDALAAGKDIYVEKPLCQTPEQGVQLVEAEEAHQEHHPGGHAAPQLRPLPGRPRDGRRPANWAAVRMVRSWWLNNYLGGAPATKLDGPLDWEQWQGPAEHRPFDANRFRQWRFYSDYAGGILADQGAHVFDGIHMLMGAGYPLAVNASAGKPHKPGVDQPESVVAIAEYPEDFVGVFTVNYAAMQYKTPQRPAESAGWRPRPHGYRPRGAEGLPQGRRRRSRPSTKKSPKGFGWATDLHVQNFLECVRTRKTPTAPMRLAFQAALVVQMANLSLKQGRRVRWNQAAARVES